MARFIMSHPAAFAVQPRAARGERSLPLAPSRAGLQRTPAHS
jgi:hypothetical protein